MKFRPDLAVAVMLLAVACSKSSNDPAPPPVEKVAPPDPKAIDAMVADMVLYTDQTVPLLLAWDGDCAAQAKRMLVLEPFAQKIRAEAAPINSSPAAHTAFKAAMEAKKATVMAAVETKLTAAGSSLQDMSRREREIREHCSSDLAFTEAMNRVGIAKQAK